MTTIQRPNRDALSRAVDVYRDAMRPFIVRCLKQVRGQRVEDLIRSALRDRQADQFASRLRTNGGDVEASIDIDNFPPLVQGLWRDAFERQLSEHRAITNRLWLIKDARNLASHPGSRDLQPDDTTNHLYQISAVLDQINAPQQAGEVRSISNEVQSRSQSGGEPTTNAPATNFARPAPSQANGNLTQRILKFIDDSEFSRADVLIALKTVFEAPAKRGKRGKLKTEDYGAIMAALKAGETNKELAAKYGVSSSRISEIRNEKSIPRDALASYLEAKYS